MSRKDCTLSQERLREVLKYCWVSGKFSWLGRGKGRVTGEVAGCTSKVGYTVIRIDGVLYQAHRLAIFYIYGAWPEYDVDHKNGVRTDNRLDNLRCATRGENLQNQRTAKPFNRSGLLGVIWSSQASKWMARVTHNGKQHHVGTFDTPEEAHAAYVVKKRQLHEFSML